LAEALDTFGTMLEARGYLVEDLDDLTSGLAGS